MLSLLTQMVKVRVSALKALALRRPIRALGAEQLALWQTEWEADIAAAEQTLEQVAPISAAITQPKGTPKRERLPDWLPRVELRHELTSCNSAQCGTPMVQIGEEIAEQLDVIPAKLG